MAALTANICFAIILCFHCALLSAEQTGTEEEVEERIDAYGLPGAQYEIKIEVGPADKQCFYQRLKKGAELHVSFEVLKGADRNIDLFIRDPENNVLTQFTWTNEGNWNKVVETDGVHVFCIDNGLSRFSSKLVYFYMVSYIIADWQKYAEEYDAYVGGIGNFSAYLGVVDARVNNMSTLQASSRQHIIKDWYLIRGNHTYVQNLSIAMCAIIILSGAFQVFFVRRLFSATGPTKSVKTKTRA